ncbi:MAG: aldehyde dehydrogenase family protein [Steroidobacteraceae bacterium]|jgi:acyl-CoA reductase-like NAD-dependent aldehyde dehydrogenase
MLEIRNPATLEGLGSAADCGPADVARAVAAARAAHPAWCTVPAVDRALLLGEIGARIRARAPEFATLLTRESGKPLCESIDCIDAAVAVFEACAARGPSDQPPTGVVAAILPFNLPLLLTAAAIAPAIAAGNAVVCKPPQQNPLTSIMLVEVFGALPAGVVNIVTGGPDTGRALVDHPDVGLVAFTGSAAVGRRIAAAAATKRIEIELGGVDGFIVCEDADLDTTVPGIAWCRLTNGGQACRSGKHIYVARSIIAEFVERMHNCVGFLDVDDPMKPATDLGPLISLEAARRVEDQVGRTLREGAKLILGGRRFRPSGLPGHFFQPTILTNVRPGSVPTREEILGPVITITPVADLAEGVGLASESGSSLGASIYTRDSETAIQALACFDVGLFRINDPATGASAGPFGGMRHRGIRRILDNEPAEAIGHLRQVQVATVMEPKPWWFPYLARKLAAARTVGSRPIS